MSVHTESSTSDHSGRNRVISIALAACVAIAIVYLVALHWQHVAPVIPALVLLACPLMHLLHHGRRHRHDDHPGAR